jgi:hypothetical protein
LRFDQFLQKTIIHTTKSTSLVTRQTIFYMISILYHSGQISFDVAVGFNSFLITQHMFDQMLGQRNGLEVHAVKTSPVRACTMGRHQTSLTFTMHVRFILSWRREKEK